MTNEKQKVSQARYVEEIPLHIYPVLVRDNRYNYEAGFSFPDGGEEILEHADDKGNYDFVHTRGSYASEQAKGIVTKIGYTNEVSNRGNPRNSVEHELTFEEFVKAGRPTSLEAVTEITFYKK